MRDLRVNPATVKAVVDWPVPKNQKKLRKSLGLASDLAICSALLQTDIEGEGTSLRLSLDRSELMKRTTQSMTNSYLQ